jgi:hypothetical protein
MKTEARIPKSERNTNDDIRIRHSSFGFLSGFGIRHSDLLLGLQNRLALEQSKTGRMLFPLLGAAEPQALGRSNIKKLVRVRASFGPTKCANSITALNFCTNL